MLKKWLKNQRTIMVLALMGAVLVLFILIPLLKMVLGSDPAILLETILEPEVVNSILLTLYAALIATVIGCVFGVPLAYVLARTEFPGKKFIEGLIDVPIVVPHSAAGIALLFVFGRSFFMGKAFGAIGVSFVDSLAGIVVAMMFVSVPFLIDAAKDGFRHIDVRLEKVARTLGASPRQVFFRVSLPLAWRSILTGNIMMWARGVSEFGAVVILAYHPMIAPILVYQRFETFGLDYARPVAVILIVISIAVFVLLRSLVYRKAKVD